MIAPADIHVVKQKLGAELRGQPWFSGIGLTRSPAGHPALMILVKDGYDVTLPRMMYGIPILTQHTGPIVAQAAGTLGAVTGYACGTANAHVERDASGELVCVCDAGYRWESKGLLGIQHCVPENEEDPCNQNEPAFNAAACALRGGNPFVGDDPNACRALGGYMKAGQCVVPAEGGALGPLLPVMHAPPDQPLELPPPDPLDKPSSTPWLLAAGALALAGAATLMFWPKKR